MSRKMVKRSASKQVEMDLKVDCTALYIRVSTEKQAEEGFSLDAQKNRLRAYCEAQGWLVCDNHIYVDAVTGTSTDNRNAFNAMMQAARDSKIMRVVAIKLDRIARNTGDFLAIVKELQGHGCDLVLIKESFDTSTPQGKFAMTMFAAIAELEASTITERVMTGKTQKASEGGYNGSACPLGYTYQDEKFAINQDGAATVRSIFQWFNEGIGMTAIANRLNLRGVATAKGGAWYAGTVRYILQNGAYAGLAQWSNIETTGIHPAIISVETYEQAHARLLTLKPGKQVA